MFGASIAARERVGRALERGAFAGALTRSIATLVTPFVLQPRPVSAPAHVRLICVGGATLGGSGKSRLANAIAHALPDAVLVGHGYRARDRRARFVDPDETVMAAGDEALAAARAGLRVVIGRTRQEAIAFAYEHTDLLVLDGPLSVTHARSVSVLAVDEDEPWGSGEVFPAGDLRAPRASLERIARFVVPVPTSLELERVRDLARPFGLFTALARPERLIRWLRPDVVISAPDHGPLSKAHASRLLSSAIPWLATEKCATHLEPLKIPVQILRDTYMGRLDRAFIRRIVSSVDCERVGREDTCNDHRPEAGR